MKGWIATALVTGMFVAAAPRAEAEVHIVIADGYVTVDAKDATVRQILDEWARVGKTRVVNGERITGTPVTLQLTRMPEAEALDIVLRSVAGYLAAPRPTPVPNASQFDRILVMPTSVAPRVAAAPAQQQPTFQPPTMPTEDLQVDDAPMPTPVGGPVQRGVFPPQFPNPAGQFQANPRQQGPPTQAPFPGNPAAPQAAPTGAAPVNGPMTTPGVMPAGVSTPGMLVAPAPAPGQPGAAPDQGR